MQLRCQQSFLMEGNYFCEVRIKKRLLCGWKGKIKTSIKLNYGCQNGKKIMVFIRENIKEGGRSCLNNVVRGSNYRSMK